MRLYVCMWFDYSFFRVRNLWSLFSEWPPILKFFILIHSPNKTTTKQQESSFCSQVCSHFVLWYSFLRLTTSQWNAQVIQNSMNGIVNHWAREPVTMNSFNHNYGYKKKNEKVCFLSVGLRLWIESIRFSIQSVS